MSKPEIHVLYCPKCDKLTEQEDYGLEYFEKNIRVYRRCAICGEYIKVTIDHSSKEGGYESEVIDKEDIPKDLLEDDEPLMPWYVV